jgi:hypothetical protein
MDKVVLPCTGLLYTDLSEGILTNRKTGGLKVVPFKKIYADLIL